MAYRVLSRDEHFLGPGPKRILALDGGGIRGILSLGILRRVETLLRERHGGDPAFRLCHYFDLIAGTSTGAIMAAALALGMTVDEVIGHYRALGGEVFAKSWLRDGVLRAQYDGNAVANQLRTVFSPMVTLGDPAIQTGLLVVTKRLDTGSPWPLGNNPRGKYFRAPEGKTWISNGDFPLWQVVRASTAAPTYFDAETIRIASEPGKKDVEGTFLDGGVSPHNNPSLQALWYATLQGYNVGWKTGAEQLLLLSVGTGKASAAREVGGVAAAVGLNALQGLMDDAADLVEIVMQWMSQSPTAREIDREFGNLRGDLAGSEPLLHYLRYNTSLDTGKLQTLLPHVPLNRLERLSKLDCVEEMDLLFDLGEQTGRMEIEESHFPECFNLKQ